MIFVMAFLAENNVGLLSHKVSLHPSTLFYSECLFNQIDGYAR